jgi:hypothetical protein
VNGITLRQSAAEEKSPSGAIIDESAENEIIKRNEVPIANVFFKFCHTDEPCAMTGFQPTKLTNHYQQIVVEEFKSVIDVHKVATASEKHITHTSTFVTYYDTIVDKS